MQWKSWQLILLLTLVIGTFIVIVKAKTDIGRFSLTSANLYSPPYSLTTPTPTTLPLLHYSIENLAKTDWQAVATQDSNSLKLLTDLSTDVQEHYSTEELKNLKQFVFSSQNKQISGIINLPPESHQLNNIPIIILLRGWAPIETYYPGMGSKNIAKLLAKNGFIAITPDFLGYGSSDSDYQDPWLARFVKPYQIANLFTQLKINRSFTNQINADPQKIAIWAHSNGGQIALNLAEILSEKIPMVLWAPVTAPFPYSILFFSDENQDEGKEARKWLSLFEKDYDVFDFSFTQHLDKLKGEIEIHHGTNDQASLYNWTTEFIDKVQQIEKKQATNSLTLKLFTYKGADHNLQPNIHWQEAANRTIIFFQKKLNYFN